MLTKLVVRNFKRFEAVDIELGSPVVFIGPNNSGKTTALQALALWDIGRRRWTEKRGGRATEWKRPGVTINRRDLLAVPIPEANLLWRNLNVRDAEVIGGRQHTRNVRVDITVEGVTGDAAWRCGLEFDYANAESIYCRPLRLSEDRNPERMPVPPEAEGVRVSFLPPMSGLADREFAKQRGEMDFLIGQGRTAEVLRNLCLEVAEWGEGDEWRAVFDRIQHLFGVRLDEPKFIPERGEITMTYRDASGVRLDLSSAGRGLQQTLLLLAYLAANPGSVLLLDEPDAHLEILRQRQTYQVLTEMAREKGGQIIAASHSEVVLNEAADRAVVVAFVGSPHRIDDRGQQALKSLRDIGFEDYYQAEQTGWVLYLEGSTDLAILQSLTRTRGHAAARVLDRPFVHYVQNKPSLARNHFYGLREAKPDLVAFALFDHIPGIHRKRPEFTEHRWRRREIENYISQPDTLAAYARFTAEAPELPPRLVHHAASAEDRDEVMRECIEEFVPRAAVSDLEDTWWTETRTSAVLERIFQRFFSKLGLPNLMNKSDYHVLAGFVPKDAIAAEVVEVLDAIIEVAHQAYPVAAEPQ